MYYCTDTSTANNNEYIWALLLLIRIKSNHICFQMMINLKLYFLYWQLHFHKEEPDASTIEYFLSEKLK